MKTLALLILVCGACYGADITTTNTTGDITLVVSERQDTDGKPRLHIETSYRGKEKILQIVSRLNKQGKMAVTMRDYFAGGEMLMVESDDDGDGTFKHLAVWLPGTDDFEMFIRQPDGSVKPVSTKEIELIKKKKAAADESLRKLFQGPEKSDADIDKLLQENRQKIQDLEDSKTNKSD